MDIGKTLTNLRKAKGISRQALADELKINIHTYIKYESNQAKPPYDVLVTLASYFEVSTDCLLGVKPKPDPFADFGLSERDEAAVLNAYMQLPKEYRACMLEILRSLSGNLKPKQDKTQTNDFPENNYGKARIAAYGLGTYEIPAADPLTDEELNEFFTPDEKKK